MKKIMTMIMVLCIVAFSGNASGQETDTKKNEKKGGFAVGGYDAAKQSGEVKRSIEIKEEADVSEKAEGAVIPPPPPPAPVQVTPPPDTSAIKTGDVKDKDAKVKASGSNVKKK